MGDSEIWMDEGCDVVVKCCEGRGELMLRLNGLTGAGIADEEVSTWEEGFDVILRVNILALEDFDAGQISVANLDDHFCGLRSRF